MWQDWTEGEYVASRETDMQRRKRESREKGKETERIVDKFGLGEDWIYLA